MSTTARARQEEVESVDVVYELLVDERVVRT
jgi:hypothetical protein